ncbi:MAG: 2-oxoacid:acceptor oxidoreductase subunit alpha [Gammaproteobacteria bacterium]|jgi:2-oxoglutarate ferredoxin oxidoreductase subunit alpha|nr:2-oxoacid:acceptor oxidoreductase subunit alpha [Gammaproteobacteria bacterium]HJP37332.1 2-oxoacid:acceptor oxidoreductase subunit alpha [Gammaproteobacteria bacterium]
MAAAGEARNLQGNRACALGAVAAGCRFFAGYPITPSSEIAETMALELPKVEGVFVQMEDEIASMGAVIGASMGGVKAMTATSGPGFSLKQENIGYAAGAEIPCVIVNVMRGGPGTGMPTRPSQGDVMQSRWGTHGDHPALVLAPASVSEIYSQTIQAFNFSEAYCVPVVVLYDEVVGHLVETVELPASDAVKISSRLWASGPKEDYQPYATDDTDVPVMARPGDGYRTHTTGLTHDATGFPTQDPDRVAAVMSRLMRKLDTHREEIEQYEAVHCEDAEVIVVAYGITARAADRAVAGAREQGRKVGLFRPITLWPFPEEAFRSAAQGARHIIVPEMNAGQLSLEIERLRGDAMAVSTLNRMNGEAVRPEEIAAEINALTNVAPTVSS